MINYLTLARKSDRKIFKNIYFLYLLMCRQYGTDTYKYKKTEIDLKVDKVVEYMYAGILILIKKLQYDFLKLRTLILSMYNM